MKKLIYLSFILCLFSCKEPKYPGFSEKSPDLFYQRLQLGEGVAYNPDSCFLDYSVSFYPLYGEEKMIHKSIKFAQLPAEVLKDSIIQNAKEGDLLNFITTRHSIYLKELCKVHSENDTILYYIEFHVDKVYNLYSQKEDPNVQEYKNLEHFFTFSSNRSAYNYSYGVWIKRISNNEASQEKINGDIVLDYAGYSLDGDMWDIPDYPLKFNLNDQYQVIRGIELALQQMNYNDSVEVIIPSYLAFGELGSKNGNIPPYKSIRYNLKVYDAVFYQDSIQATIE